MKASYKKLLTSFVHIILALTQASTFSSFITPGVSTSFPLPLFFLICSITTLQRWCMHLFPFQQNLGTTHHIGYDHQVD